MNDKIDIKYGSLFPLPFRFIAAIVLLIGLSLIVEKTLLSISLMLMSGFVLSGYEGTEINKIEKSYFDYKSFFFLEEWKGEEVSWS